MVVGTARLVLAIPGASSLKDKRSVVRRVIERARSRFNAAVAEVEDQDVHRRAVIGVAVVSNDTRHATSMLDTIIAMMASSSTAEIVSRRASVVRVGEHDLSEELASGGSLEATGLDPWDEPDDEGER
jgi:uncharacterized protein YlxP (DUF503 family)